MRPGSRTCRRPASRSMCTCPGAWAGSTRRPRRCAANDRRGSRRFPWRASAVARSAARAGPAVRPSGLSAGRGASSPRNGNRCRRAWRTHNRVSCRRGSFRRGPRSSRSSGRSPSCARRCGGRSRGRRWQNGSGRRPNWRRPRPRRSPSSCGLPRRSPAVGFRRSACPRSATGRWGASAGLRGYGPDGRPTCPARRRLTGSGHPW